ncbi:Bet v I/Major latex protein [Dillenia turbinata]|uniref:Bet v I/Major latex protein n=1 Tax=Dillenia turbinata TaxID=194707 RepID=A0AAN8US98_9MAGN
METKFKCSPDAFFDVVKGKNHHLPKAVETIRNIEVHEGDWETEGSIKHWDYICGGPLNHYKANKAHVHVLPKEVGGIAKWTLEYEKLRADDPPPHKYIQWAIHITQDLEDYLLKTAV